MNDNAEDRIKQCRAEVEGRIDIQQEKLEELHKCLHKNTTKLEELHDDHTKLSSDIAELLSIFRAGKGAIRVFGWFGIAVRWIVAVGIAIAAIVAFIKGGLKP